MRFLFPRHSLGNGSGGHLLARRKDGKALSPSNVLVPDSLVHFEDAGEITSSILAVIIEAGYVVGIPPRSRRVHIGGSSRLRPVALECFAPCHIRRAYLQVAKVLRYAQ